MSNFVEQEDNSVDLKPLVEELVKYIDVSRQLQKAESTGYNLKSKDSLIKRRVDLESSLFNSLVGISTIDLELQSDDSTINTDVFEEEIKSLLKTAETKNCSINKVRPLISGLSKNYQQLAKNANFVIQSIIQYILSGFLGIHCTALDSIDYLDDKLESLTKENRSLSQDIEQIRQNFSESQERESILQNLLEEKKVQFQTQEEDHFAQINHYKKELANAQELITRSTVEHENSLETSSTNRTEFENNFKRLEKENKRLNLNLQNAESELLGLKESLLEKEEEVNRFKAESVKQKELSKNIKTELNSVQIAEQKAQAQNRKLKTDLIFKQETINQLQSEVTILRDQTVGLGVSLAQELDFTLHFPDEDFEGQLGRMPGTGEIETHAEDGDGGNNAVNNRQVVGAHTEGNQPTATEQIGLQLSAQLGELFSREEKKSIPLYKGQADDSDVKEWLIEAERIARNNSWSDNQKVRFFSDRLKGEALDWHLDYTEKKNIENKIVTYKDWREDFIKRFHDKADIERLRTKLQTLKQRSDQRARAFVARIDSLYTAINGKDIVLDASADEKSLQIAKVNKTMRDEERKKILLRGLLPKLKTEVWSRMPPNPSYEKLCDTVYDAEGVIMAKELAEEHAVNAIIEHNCEIERVRRNFDNMTT